MKNRYTKDDFITAFARQFFDRYIKAIDFDVLEKYSDESARAECLNFLTEIVERMSEDGPGQAIPDDIQGLSLSDGRFITLNELKKLTRSHEFKHRLDAMYLLEQVFQEYSSAYDILEFLRHNEDHEFHDKFDLYLRRFPAEATYIRIHIANPDIMLNVELYNFVIEELIKRLDDVAIGSELGPRMPVLVPEIVRRLLNLWDGIDEDINKILFGDPDERPEPGSMN